MSDNDVIERVKAASSLENTSEEAIAIRAFCYRVFRFKPMDDTAEVEAAREVLKRHGFTHAETVTIAKETNRLKGNTLANGMGKLEQKNYVSFQDTQTNHLCG